MKHNFTDSNFLWQIIFLSHYIFISVEKKYFGIQPKSPPNWKENLAHRTVKCHVARGTGAWHVLKLNLPLASLMWYVLRSVALVLVNCFVRFLQVSQNNSGQGGKFSRTPTSTLKTLIRFMRKIWCLSVADFSEPRSLDPRNASLFNRIAEFGFSRLDCKFIKRFLCVFPSHAWASKSRQRVAFTSDVLVFRLLCVRLRRSQDRATEGGGVQNPISCVNSKLMHAD